MTLHELRAAALAKAEALRAKVTGEERVMTDEERSEFQGHLDEVDRIAAQIEQESRFAKTKTEMDQTRADQAVNRPRPGAEVHDNAEDAPFRSLGEQLLAVRRAAEDRDNMDPRLRKLDVLQSKVRAASGLNETVASDGGFLVGVDENPTLLQNAFQQSNVWSRAQNYTISSNANGMKFKTIDETSRVDGSRWGGVQVYLANEADSATSSKPKFGEIQLSLQKLMGLAYMTDEQLMDAAITEQVVSKAFSEEFAFKLDDLAIRGTGAGAPLGILNAACTVSQAKESSQAAATILYENVSKMRTRMLPRSFSNAVWFINVDCMPTLEKMVIPHKNVAGTENVSGQAVWVPARGAADPPNGTIFGRPVVPIEQCETVGTVGDIILADMGMYLTISKGGLQTASSIHVKFLTDEMAFRFILRIDGQPALKSAITPFKGSNTLSSFVTLATRA